MVPLFFGTSSARGVELEAIRKAAEEICDREACVLWDVELFGSGRGRTLRVTIDGKDREVSIAECENVSKALNLILDVQDLVPGGPYQLEVSSPGIERSLKELWQFERMKTSLVEILLSERIEVPSGDPLRLKGSILGVDGEVIRIARVEGDEVNVEFPLVKRAKTIFDDRKSNKRS